MEEIKSSSDAMAMCDTIEKQIEEKNNQIDVVQTSISKLKLDITTLKRDVLNKEIEMSGLRRALDAAKHSKENLTMQYDSAKRKYFSLGKQGL